MIYLAYATHTAVGDNKIRVNGHKSRCFAIAQNLVDEYSFIEIGRHGAMYKYSQGDVLIIDAGTEDYEYLLSPNVYSVLISDNTGIRYEETPVDLIVYVSGGGRDYSFVSDYIGHLMFYTNRISADENSWTGGDYVLFIPGSNAMEFWNTARRYEDWCKENSVSIKYVNGSTEHGKLMELARHAKVVITAAGVTAKEMVYQAAPSILIKTADNQQANYAYFIQRGLAMPQDVDPDIIGDNLVLEIINKDCKLAKKLNTIDMIKMIYDYKDEK